MVSENLRKKFRTLGEMLASANMRAKSVDSVIPAGKRSQVRPDELQWAAATMLSAAYYSVQREPQATQQLKHLTNLTRAGRS
jgi:hypothetical protein